MSIEDDFSALVAAVAGARAAGERFTVAFAAEDTDFVRFNRGRVRQSGSVVQRTLTLRLIHGARHATHTLSLTGDVARDVATVRTAMADLRAVLPDLAEDALLLLPDGVRSSREVRDGAVPAAEDAVDAILAAADGLDLVGFYAAGPVWRGFANSEGQHNAYTATTFNLQWSLYHGADKAVRSAYAGFHWDAAQLGARMQQARERLALVARAPRTLAPGRYRAYLAPGALEELTALLCWDAFSGRALQTHQSALDRLQEGAAFDPRVTFVEDTQGGVAPAFQNDGFVRPPRVPLVEHGRLAGSLVSPRTAREFGLVANGANDAESPESLVLEGGDLPAADALTALDTGLAIGNLWYLNYSDRPAGRITGMTRFATFWVEHGRVVAPVNVLRFDDTLYRMLGSNLEALTRETELMLESSTYGARALGSVRLPGMLVKELAFTL
ncbi:MAG: TldE/PmbA family protein [Burkholderiales bacterium]|nr:TldE/PmbA family protein [Burkholderiales bacterium]